jgi:phosphoserine aminotransferase
MNKYNFSAGPARLDPSVIEKAKDSIINYEESGISILEISHRSKEYKEIMEKLKANLTSLLNIPDDYFILLLQGGATYQNTFIPYNYGLHNKIGCLITGEWSKKTFEDFRLVKDIEMINLEDSKIEKFLSEDNNEYFKDTEYLHITSNETINGIQIRDFKQIQHPSLIIDMSSDLGSYKFDWDNLKYIYAGAQKNMGIPGVTICIGDEAELTDLNNPSYLNLNKLSENDSVLNTPSTFSVYILHLVCEWMIKLGGLDYFETQSKKHSSLLYDQLETYSDKILLPVSKFARSRSNIVFNFIDSSLEEEFLTESEKNNIIGIKGHRSVGGIRISLYNAVDNEMVNYISEFISKFFEKK